MPTSVGVFRFLRDFGCLYCLFLQGRRTVVGTEELVARPELCLPTLRAVLRLAQLLLLLQVNVVVLHALPAETRVPVTEGQLQAFIAL